MAHLDPQDLRTLLVETRAAISCIDYCNDTLTGRDSHPLVEDNPSAPRLYTALKLDDARRSLQAVVDFLQPAFINGGEF